MKKGNLSVRNRKRLARLKRQIKEIEEMGYKHDLDESWFIAGERNNNRYSAAVKEVNELNNSNQK